MNALRATLAGPGTFRLSLALLVFVHHITRLALGMSAVYIFFELSGFWICTMWNERYSKASFPYGVYLVSRSWRLLPVFIFCASISWAVILFWHRPPLLETGWLRQIASNLLILGYSSLDFQANRPAWTLDLELQFYIIAPLLILFMRNRLPLALALCAGLSLLGYFIDYPYFVPAHSYTLVPHPTTVMPYLIFFSIGVAAASAKWRPSRLLGIGSLVATMLVVVACIASPLHGLVFVGASPDPSYGRFNEGANVVFALLMAPWAMYTTGTTGWRYDSIFGDLSYIVYLLQWSVLEVVDTGSGTLGQRAVVALEALAILLIGSFLIWRFLDHPINRLRSRWVAARIDRPDPIRVAAPSLATGPSLQANIR